MIFAGSNNVSGAIQIVKSDGNGVISPVDLTGMTLEVRFWDVGRVGAYRRWNYDYGKTPQGWDPLLVVPQGTVEDGSGYIVIDTPAEGIVHYSLTPAQATQLLSRSIVDGTAPRRLVRQIWRIDEGAEAMLMEAVEWAKA